MHTPATSPTRHAFPPHACRLVERLKWMSPQVFAELFALGSTLPGPTSTQVHNVFFRQCAKTSLRLLAFAGGGVSGKAPLTKQSAPTRVAGQSRDLRHKTSINTSTGNNVSASCIPSPPGVFCCWRYQEGRPGRPAVRHPVSVPGRLHDGWTGSRRSQRAARPCACVPPLPAWLAVASLARLCIRQTCIAATSA